MTENSKEPFIRWQGRSLDYLSYAVNLLLGFSIAALGFGANLLRDDSFRPTGCCKGIFGVSFLALIFASGVGIACVLNRLKDFRMTAAIARKKSKGEIDEEIDELRVLVGVVTKKTRKFFTWQVGLFGLGVLLLIISMLSVYSEKVF